MNRIILTVSMLICAVALSVALAPALWADWNLRNQELVTGSTSAVNDATCKTRVVVSFCTIEKRQGFPAFYMITGLGDGERLTVLRPKSAATNSGEFTTNVGVTYFWNRLITFLAALGISLGLAIAAMRRWIPGL